MENQEEAVELVLDLPSDLDAIEPVVSYVTERCRGLPFERARLDLNLRVGLTEVLANAILYGNGSDPEKSVRLEATIGAEAIELRVFDQGEGFDPREVPDPTRPENLERGGGRGLFLIHHLMDEVEYNERGNAVCLLLRARGS